MNAIIIGLVNQLMTFLLEDYYLVAVKNYVARESRELDMRVGDYLRVLLEELVYFEGILK